MCGKELNTSNSGEFYFYPNFSEFSNRMESRIPPMPSRRPPPRSSSNDSQGFEKTDGSQSDSAVSNSITEGRSKRRPSLSHKIGSFVGLRRRSSSANQLGVFQFLCFRLALE